ncbi:phosphoribosylanthranilate isomerase [Psychrobacillus sp. FJAT-51614]|uniref:N-(5'-phosphoribosyl)anthranilate isomerase n=1 Tax=Psychrobacillus mangrovi TaxID=3117745 RepID=A0ABU8F1Q6_9BACI
MTKVKICGLMKSEDVKAAIEAGADAVGFVFAPSKREITIELAKELAKEVPEGVLKVGVFVNPTTQELENAVREVPLDYVQYHGIETPEFIQAHNYPSIKALSVRKEEDVERAKQYNTQYFLFDAPRAGSGITFDWQLMKGHDFEQEKVILAGGLNPTNVKEAINRVKPYMVDVSSGVEINGKKDSKLIREFIRAVKDEE